MSIAHFLSLYIYQRLHSQQSYVIQAIYPKYKPIKESYNMDISSAFQLHLENSIEETKTRKINSMTRRGYPPTSNIRSGSTPRSAPIDQHLPDRDLNSAWALKRIHEEKYKYPWTAFGTVSLMEQSNKKSLGMGIIIGAKFVLTARFPELYQSHHGKANICFIPCFGKEETESYLVQKMYPLHKISGSEMNEPRSQNLQIAVLELNDSSRIEEKYGSIGYNFNDLPNQPASKLFIAGMIQSSDKQQLIVINTEIKVDKRCIYYNLPSEQNLALGSPILSRWHGQLFAIGVHIGPQLLGQQLGTKLDKDSYHHKLNKFSLQGYELDLSHKALRAKEIRYLKEFSLKNAVSIDLQATQVEAAGLRTLKKGSIHSLLEELNLNNNRLVDQCITCISSARWNNLTHLFLSHNKLTNQGMNYLSLNVWRNLTKLELNNNPIGNKGVHYLVRNDWLLLERLSLSETAIDSYACEKLRKGRFPSLTELTLRKNQIQSEGVKWLAQADWPSLRYLDLSKNGLIQEGIKSLLKGNWKKLHILRIEATQLRMNRLGLKGKLKAKFQPLIFIV